MTASHKHGDWRAWRCSFARSDAPSATIAGWATETRHGREAGADVDVSVPSSTSRRWEHYDVIASCVEVLTRYDSAVISPA